MIKFFAFQTVNVLNAITNSQNEIRAHNLAFFFLIPATFQNKNLLSQIIILNLPLSMSFQIP